MSKVCFDRDDIVSLKAVLTVCNYCNLHSAVSRFISVFHLINTPCRVYENIVKMTVLFALNITMISWMPSFFVGVRTFPYAPFSACPSFPSSPFSVFTLFRLHPFYVYATLFDFPVFTPMYLQACCRLFIVSCHYPSINGHIFIQQIVIIRLSN